MWLLLLVVALSSVHAQDDPFDHKKHAPLKLACTYCHTTAEKAERASFPALSQCKTCHTAIAERKIPAQRVYRNKDFVFFSHAKHTVEAQLKCASCHGEVYLNDTAQPARPTTMIACVECHKASKASTQCNVCHELGQ